MIQEAEQFKMEDTEQRDSMTARVCNEQVKNISIYRRFLVVGDYMHSVCFSM